MGKTKKFLSRKRLLQFVALQNCLVPCSSQFTLSEQQLSAQLVEVLISQQSVTTRKKLAVFINLIDFVSIIFFRRKFINLSQARKTTILKKFYDSPIFVLRKVFTGLNTLARAGVYGQPEIGLKIANKPVKVRELEAIKYREVPSQ